MEAVIRERSLRDGCHHRRAHLGRGASGHWGGGCIFPGGLPAAQRGRTAACVPAAGAGLKPARCIPRCTSGFFIKMFHTKPVRAFSAISMVMPVSMPITSGSYQSFSGLKAFTNPYWLHALG